MTIAVEQTTYEQIYDEVVSDTGVEALYCGSLYRPAPYYAKLLNKIDNGKGYWNYLNVGIFERPVPQLSLEQYWIPKRSEKDKQIGEYKRNYSSLFRTFHPFQLRGKWYALYSKDYTCTRLMELPSCKDIGGEKSDCCGFCPVDYWVPDLHYIETKHDDSCPRSPKQEKPDYSQVCKCGEDIEHTKDCSWVKFNGKERCTCDRNNRYFEKYHVWHFPDRIHGFVAGCVWGDDSSWKIEYLDLSKADQGIIKREPRFGYIEMPDHLDLNKTIRLEAYDDSEEDYYLTIAVQKHFNLKTGKEIE